MVDQEWDVILIGAGQNNFTLGAFLGKAGLKTVVCETRLENGGRLASEELLYPGYWHNTLWYFVDKVELSPLWKALDWTGEHHATFIEPPVITTLLLPDGESISQYQDLDATCVELAKYSQHDAQAWRKTHDKYTNLVCNYLVPSLYHPVGSPNGLAKVRDGDPARADFERLCAMTPKQVVDELFENDTVKTLVLSQMAIPRGVAIDYPGAGYHVLMMVAGDERPKLTRGGIHEIAQVLQRSYVHNGGQIRAMHHVEKILVENGRAIGVRLRDGREWKARLAVVSNLDPHTTLIDMVGKDKLDAGLVQKIENLQYDEFSYFQIHLAINNRVRYGIHEVIDDAASKALNVVIGPTKVADLEAMWREIRAGEFPTHYCMQVTCPTALDPLQAPLGKHNASVYMPVPYQLRGHQPEDWVKLKNEYLEKMLNEWRKFATNLQESEIHGRVAMDPWYLSGKWQNLRRGSVNVLRKVPAQMGENRPLPELNDYRTPIDGLYMVGVGTFPADEVVAGSGYNAWQVIKDDLKLEIKAPAHA